MNVSVYNSIVLNNKAGSDSNDMECGDTGNGLTVKHCLTGTPHPGIDDDADKNILYTRDNGASLFMNLTG